MIAEAKPVMYVDLQSRYDTGPLAKANKFIAPAPLSKLIDVLREKGWTENFAIGKLEQLNGSFTQVAVSINDDKPEKYFEKGMNKRHSFFYSTPSGNKRTSEMITVTGMITVGEKGEIKKEGNVDMNAKTTVMFFK